ncbi:MAG: hypothetical protein ABIT05_13230 [Chitinophagaceae bacterium]
MENNWDPEVKKFFLRILNSVSLGLLWMMACATAGIYYKLGYFNGQPVIFNILFYTAMLGTLWLLIRYLYRNWKDK